ncbi:replication initiator protein A [Deinococcus lacus]|uniref:Replication initiator protein A n=1 Tax=Deinococcus lacus TaxID=392561 RepID=A0ABW1YH95_9DEIO
MAVKGKRATQKKLPTPRAELSRIDEANVGRLGLISIQERIPDTFTSWTVDFQIDGRPARLSCESVPKYGGVPHGLDGDIATAIIDLYVEEGCPPDGTLLTTAYQLLKRAGLNASGRYYQNLRSTLFRLRLTTYIASEAWHDFGRGNWTTVTFNYLEALEFTSGDEELGLSSASTLKIRLAEPIVRSIRAQYTKPLDLEFLTSLERPLTRALYRLLDARRYPPEDPRLPLPSLTFNVVEWAKDCKIVDQRSNKIRSTLQGAHDELIERGYLLGVDYEGRGSQQQLTYRFVEGEVAREVDSQLVAELRKHKVSEPVARRLILQFGEEHVQQRLQKFRALMESGYRVRSRSALLVDVIRDQEGKYAEVAATAEAAEKPAYMPTLAEAMNAPEPLEVQVETALRTLQFLLREQFSVSEYALIRIGLVVGELSPRDLSREATRAKSEGHLDKFASELRARLVLLSQKHAERVREEG